MKPSYRANDESDWTACDGRNRVRIYVLECLFRLVVLLICQRASAANAFAPGCFCTDHPCLMHLLLPPFHHPALPLPHLLTAPVDTNKNIHHDFHSRVLSFYSFFHPAIVHNLAGFSSGECEVVRPAVGQNDARFHQFCQYRLGNQCSSIARLLGISISNECM